MIGVGRSVMENGELYGPRFLRPPRLATSCSAASARRPAGGTASVTGQTCSALHCALAIDSVMETELTAGPNTNSGLHYMHIITCIEGGYLGFKYCSYMYSLLENGG